MMNIIKAADAAQFLALVPRLLGFLPRRSLVLVPFDRGRSLGAMRFDLPPDGVDPEAIASTIVGMVCRVQDADGFAAAVYTDEALERGTPMPRAELIRLLEQRADVCGLHVIDALCVASESWGAYARPGDEPQPLAQIRGDDTSEPSPAVDQLTGAGLPDVSETELASVARALGELDRALFVLCSSREDTWSDPRPRRPRGACSSGSARAEGRHGRDDDGRIDPLALSAACLLDDLPELFEQTLRREPTSLDAYETAALAWCLARPSLRDIALVQWTAGLAAGDDALDAQLRWESGEEYPADLAMLMWGEGERPDAGRLVAALDLARHVAASAPRDSRPGALSMCAWLSWALGRSSHADVYARAACEIEPEHGLSEIVLSFVHAAHLPDWAFQRR